MPSIELSLVAGEPLLGGVATLATGVNVVGTTVGTPVKIHPRLNSMSNKDRTIAIKFTKHALVDGTFVVQGRVNPLDDDGWVTIGGENAMGTISNLTGPAYGLNNVGGVDVAIVVLGADYREIRVDVAIATSGTVDIDVAVGW